MTKITIYNILQKSNFSTFKRYVLFGLASNFLIYCVYLSITAFGMEHKLAMTILYLIGTFISYLGNKTWTFRYKGKISTSFIKFISLYLFGYLINLLLLFYFVDLLNYPHQLVQIIAVIFLAVLLFFLSRFFVFPSLESDEKA